MLFDETSEWHVGRTESDVERRVAVERAAAEVFRAAAEAQERGGESPSLGIFGELRLGSQQVEHVLAAAVAGMDAGACLDEDRGGGEAAAGDCSEERRFPD